MKKIFVLLLAVVLVCAGSAISASAAELPATCPHCNKEVSWVALDETASQQTTLAEGHYYLAFTDTTATWNQKIISKNVCLYMNGKTLKASTDRVFDVNGELSLIGEGKVLGRAFTTESTGGTINVTGTVNIYGTTISTTAETGRTTSQGGVFYVAGTLNMYSGTITGGTASKNGGSVYVSGNMNMYGGSISGGKTSGSGGLIYSVSGSKLLFAGGSVTCDIEGSTTKCVFARGSVILSGDANVSQIRFPSISPKKFIIHGEYTGSAQITYTAATNQGLTDGTVIGSGENADLTGSKLTIRDRACYVAANGDALKISFAKPAGRKTAYCEYCKKTVAWTGLTESDNLGGDMESGHYFLDFKGDSCEFATMNLKNYNRMCLDLNGKHLNSKDRAFHLYKGILNIMDSSKAQTGLITGRGAAESSPAGGTIYVYSGAELNLFSGNISYKKATDGRNRVVRGGVIYVAGGIFNMYGGKIYGGNAQYGANVAVWNDGTSYGAFRISGGEIGNYLPENGATTKGMGIYSCGYVTVSGDPVISDLYFAEDSAVAFQDMLTIDGSFSGNVGVTFGSYSACRAIGYGKDADFNDATISVTNAAGLKLDTYGDKLFFTSGLPYLIEQNGLLTSYKTLQNAIDAYTDGKIILMETVTADIAVAVNKDIVLDLNGFDMNGNVSGNGNIVCMDSCTADYAVADGIYGEIPASITNVVAAEGYFEIVENNKRSFHRLDLQIRNVSLRSNVAGLYFSCDFAGDEMVKEKISAFGIALNTQEAPTADNMGTTSLYTSFTADKFNTAAANSVLLSNIFKAGNSDSVNSRNGAQRVYGRAYIMVGGEYVYGDAVSCTLKQVLTAVNNNWAYLTVPQKIGFMELYGRHKRVMMPYASSLMATYETIQTVNATDYSAYACPWTGSVIDAAKADGKLHYYFMAGEGGTFSPDSEPEKWGDSYLLVFPNGQTMLIDTGYSAYGPLLTQNLMRMGVEKLDYLVITHPHADRLGGSFYETSLLNMEYGLINCFEIGQVYYRGGSDPESTDAALVPDACTQLGLPCKVWEKGDSLTVAGVRLDVLWPMTGEGDTVTSGVVEVNDRSIVIRVEYGEHTGLLTGDLYKSGEESLLANTELALLDVDLLKVPHHGYSSSSSLPAFIETLSPEIAVAIGRVAKEDTVTRYEGLGVKYLCDWLNGYIHIAVGEDGIMKETHTRNNTPKDFS